jgi:biofilm protein TabA
MKKFFSLLVAVTCLAAFMISCSSSGHFSNDTGDQKRKDNWYKSQEWLNGLKLKPHESVNQEEFSRQYHANKVWWDEAFNFLKTHELLDLKPGSYVIDTGNVIATVSELNPKEKDEVNWEAHRNFNDLQYVIKGKVQMGVAAISDPNAKVTVPYAPKPDTETFSVAGGKYYDAQPGTFFIFSPKEIHRPAFKAAGYDLIKKVVIKVRVPQ